MHEAAPGTLRRSVALFGAFRVEQTDPDRFYGLLARDSVRQVGQYVPLAGRTVLDVGGGPGYFAAAFAAAGATYLAVDADAGELSARGAPGPRTALGSGTALPVRDGAVDICLDYASAGAGAGERGQVDALRLGHGSRRAGRQRRVDGESRAESPNRPAWGRRIPQRCGCRCDLLIRQLDFWPLARLSAPAKRQRF